MNPSGKKKVKTQLKSRLKERQKGRRRSPKGSDVTARPPAKLAPWKSQEQYQMLIEYAADAFYLHDHGKFLDVNQNACENLGYTREELLKLSVHHISKTFSRRKVLQTVKQMVPGVPLTIDAIHIRKNGSTFPVEIRSVLIEPEGRKLVLSLARDMTERKLAQEALNRTHDELAHTLKHLQRLSHHILQIQENEYRSVSRELHDNIAQSVNAVKVKLERLERNPALKNQKGLSDHRQEIRESVLQLMQISQEIRRLSKQMRPEILEELGLVAALESYIRDFQKSTAVQTEFICRMNDESIPSGVETHLYRIAQEGLSNIAKHAHAKNAVIEMGETKNGLLLSIEDDGIGCETDLLSERKTHFRGIGWISIKERANLLKGTAEIQSTPGMGTKVTIRIPFPEK